MSKKFFMFVALLSLSFLTGCLIYPYSEKHTIAVRPGSGTNIVERLVLSESGVGQINFISWEGSGLINQPYTYKYYVERSSWSRTKVTCLTFIKKDELDVHLLDWYFRPVMGTNLWVAINYRGHEKLDGHGANKWDLNFFLQVYIFSPTEIVRHRELTTFVPWDHDDSIPDFRFDASNQHLTYMVTNGYETYDLLRDAVYPSGVPAGEPALTRKNF